MDGAETTIYSKTMPYGYSLCGDQMSDLDGETGEFSHMYDGIGNLLWNESYEYTWENGRELASITDKSTQAIVASFEYDSDGLRISKTTSQSGTVYYVYDENSNLIFERHSDYILAFHYDGNGIRTHFDHITDSATSTYYYRYNLQGDVIALLNSSGTIVEEYEYDPYGIQLTTASGIGAINPFRYRGYYYNSETGYYYLQSRYYDPTICRFINADDISFLGASGTLLGLNLYIYCENDPINNVDNTGCFGTPIQWAMAAIGAIVGWRLGDYVAHQYGYHWGWKYWAIRTGVTIGTAVIGWFAAKAITVIVKNFLLANRYLISKIPKWVLWFLGLGNLVNYANFQNQAKLTEHFIKHGHEWGKRFINSRQYLDAANNLLRKSGSKIYQFTSADGWLFKYDRAKNEFLLLNPQGTISTFFRPVNGYSYWLEQVARYKK